MSTAGSWILEGEKLGGKFLKARERERGACEYHVCGK